MVNTCPAPWGDHKQGGPHANHLPCSKCNTTAQGERDEVGTANGISHLKGSVRQLQAFGQPASCAWVCRPSENGWEQRLGAASSPSTNPLGEDENAGLSMGTGQGCHYWLCAGPVRVPQ